MDDIGRGFEVIQRGIEQGQAEGVFRAELDTIAALNGATVHYLVGERGTWDMPTEPLGPASLAELVPDIVQRDVFLCGPVSMMDTVRRSLRLLGVPANQVHSERFGY